MTPTYEVFKYDGDDYYTAVIDAPQGMLFADTLSHSVREVAHKRSEAVKIAKAVAAGPLTPCADPDCDTCERGE